MRILPCRQVNVCNLSRISLGSICWICKKSGDTKYCYGILLYVAVKIKYLPKKIINKIKLYFYNKDLPF